jgi:glycosyltransferase involved in cell wall biosynthesis
MIQAPTISLVIPVYNEASHFEESLRIIQSELEKMVLPYEIVLVNDGSKDGTWELLKRLALMHPELRALNLSRNFGKEAATRAGLEAAQGDAVITMDGDLQHPPSLIPTMIQKWREGNVQIIDAVKISRGKESLLSKIRARMFYSLFNKLAGYNLHGASDFKLMDRAAVNALLSMPEYHIFFRGMASWVGFKRHEIPFAVEPRKGGVTGWSIFRLIRLALTAVTAFSSFPLHFITLTGVVFGLFAVLLGIQTVFTKLSGDALPGYTTVVLLLLIIGSALMIGLGVLGEYIARIYDEVKRRPRYLVAEKIGNEK